MSIRVKVFLIIMVIVLAITASSVIVSVSTAQNRILKTLEVDMEEMAKLASQNITGEIDKLETDASAIAHVIRSAQLDEVMNTLMDHIAIYPDFLSISVINAAGMVEASYPQAPPMNLIKDEQGVLSPLAKLAFEGDKVISTTYLSSQSTESGMVFYVFVPMEDYRMQAITGNKIPNPKIVALTVDAQFFNERVKRYTILKSGNITMLDRDGKIIASVKEDLVTNQTNYIKLADEDGRYQDAARVFRHIVNGETGAGRYSLAEDTTNKKIDYITAFTPITASETGWSLVLAAPIAESAFFEIRFLLIISGLVFFGLGLIAAGLASGVIAKPFEVAKELAKAKTSFLANLSHDMRTPLNVVIGLSDLSLSQKNLPKDVTGNLETIYETGNSLLGMVNDLLDISNMDSGKFGIMPAEYELPVLVNDTIEANLPFIGSKPINFKILLDEKLPVKLIGDRLRLRQIFNNLLINAFQDSSEGTVEWKIAVEGEGENIRLISSVSDTGSGIKLEDIDKVFLDYSNQDSSQKRSLKGAGLSLALTKRMTDLMGGTITVESTLGKGSVFTVNIPQQFVIDKAISREERENLIRSRPAEKSRRDNADIERANFTGKRALVVDDGRLNLDVARRMIEPYGITVDCVSDGQETIDLIRGAQPHYDAIFMTSMMPGMFGKEVARSIRHEIGSEYAKTVPIIALTTNTIAGNTDIFLKWGFQDILSKPLDIHRLDKVICRWIGGEKTA